MSIKTLTIQGYRSIQKLSLQMEAVNVVTGSNGCGKIGYVMAQQRDC